MRHKSCKKCMWWWDLYDTDEWMCYNKKSPFFHKLTENGCKKREDLNKDRKNYKLGYYKSSKKEERSK